MTKMEVEYIKQGLQKRLLNTALLNLGEPCKDISVLFEGIANKDIPVWFEEICKELDDINS